MSKLSARGQEPRGQKPGAGPPEQARGSEGTARAQRLARDALRAAILRGDVAPGQRLVEEELAARFDVTRASLRAALIDLTAEGLVERVPNRGARVRAVPIGEAIEITECRMVLEGLCAARAAERATKEQVARLRQIGEEMEEATTDPMRYSSLNHDLHRMIHEISGQETAARLLERLHGQLVRHQFRLALRPGRIGASLPEHLAMIDAIAGRAPERARKAAHDHLSSVTQALITVDQDWQRK